MVREVGGDLGLPSKTQYQRYWRKSRKKHEDPPEGMYEEVDDSGRGERGM